MEETDGAYDTYAGNITAHGLGWHIILGKTGHGWFGDPEDKLDLARGKMTKELVKSAGYFTGGYATKIAKFFGL